LKLGVPSLGFQTR
jgi:hypothetical protein